MGGHCCRDKRKRRTCQFGKHFNLKKSPATAKAKIPEGEEDKQFKPDHFEMENPKPNSRRHVYSTTAAAKPDSPLTSTIRAGKHRGRTILTGEIR